MNNWVRLWHDMPTDPKWRGIARRSGATVSEVIAIFTFAMVNASANASERGRTHNLFADDLADALSMDEARVQAVLDAMKGKVLCADGFLTGWEKRQPKREDSSAERAAAWRAERKRTQANASERPDKDADTDSEKKKEEVDRSPAASSKKGTRLPSDWRPSEDDLTFARTKLSPQDTTDAADRFRDHWLSQPGGKGVKLDWPATWRNWVRNTRPRSGTPEGKPTGGNGSGLADMAEIARRRREARNPADVPDDGWLSTGSDGVFVRGPDA